MLDFLVNDKHFVIKIWYFLAIIISLYASQFTFKTSQL